MADEHRLIPRLIAAERSLQEVCVPPRAAKRIADRMARELDRVERSRRIAWMPMLTFVAGAALVLSFLAVLRDVRDAAQRSGASTVAATIAGPDCRHVVDDRGALALHGACELSTSAPAMRVQTVIGAELQIDDRVVHLTLGSALFDVEPVAGEPVRIVVPGGTIVVVGTRFRVVVTDAGGQVDLYEGALEFRADDGSVAPIAAGEQFSFGASEPPATVVAAPAPTPMPAVERTVPVEPPRRVERRPRPRADVLVEEVRRLRHRGEYEQAATRLRDALAERWPAHTAEVLSYELGTILARHLGERAAACTHWRRHLQRFPASRYRQPIERSIAVLACP